MTGRGIWVGLLASAVACAGEPAETAEGTEAAPSLRPAPTGEAPLVRREAGPYRNLLIISVDTLRRDAVGRWGGQDDTPFLDARLAEGVALDDFQSCANSTPAAFLCLYTGQAVHDWDFQLREGPDGLEPLPPHVQLSSELFDELGFRTGTVTASSMMAELVPGFLDTFEDGIDAEWEGHHVTREALDLAERYAGEGRRWMLHVHYMEPHAPLTPDEDFLTELVAHLPEPPPSWTFGNLWMRQLHTLWPDLTDDERNQLMAHVRARYRASVRMFDAELARLWAGLDAQGLLDDTLVVLWSDHGEQFNERGRWTHGMDIFHEELATLAGFWGQGLAPASWGGPTDVTDLLPTALSALGLDGEPAATAALEEITGYVVGTAPAARPRAVVWQGDTSRLAFRLGDHALVYDLDGEAWFFDTAADPAQLQDRYDPADPAVIALWERLALHLPVLTAEIADDDDLTPPPGLSL